MTNSDRKRDSAVVISSTMPSAKYSCSGIAGHVLERQHSNGWLARNHKIERADGQWNRRRSGGRLVRDADCTNEPVAASRQGLDPILAAGHFAEHPAQRRDLDGKVALSNGKAGPRGFHQRVPGNGNPWALHEGTQHRDGTMTQRDRLGAAEQYPGFDVEPKWTEAVSPCHSSI